MAINQDIDSMNDFLQDLIDDINGLPGPLNDPAKTAALGHADDADAKAVDAQADSNISSLTPTILFTGWSTNAATCADEIKAYSAAANTEIRKPSPNYQVVCDNIATVRNGIPVVKSDINGFG